MNKKIGVVALVLILGGCANDYRQFYHPANGATPEAVAAGRANPPPAEPRVERYNSADANAVVKRFAHQGYRVIGSANFTTGQRVSDQQAIDQAKDVGADVVVLFAPRDAGTSTAVVPITTPTRSTTYSTGTATAMGPGGSAVAYGSGAATTYGSTTNYVPVTIHRTAYGAVFLVKAKQHLGVNYRDLNDAERAALQTNKGVVIQLVVDNTPAFDADILVGDILLAIDGVEVTNSGVASSLIKERAGRTITVALLRGDKRLEKTIQTLP